MSAFHAEDSADVSQGAFLADDVIVWHLAQIREGAHIGENCIIGRGAYIGTGVIVGKNCKIQNHALVYEPAILEDGVFVGPAAVLTNDEFPRAVTTTGDIKSATDWNPVGVHVKNGASIGANATCIAPLVIGKWALVGAGAVVTKDVPDFALVVGNPAKRICWVGKAGKPLISLPGEGLFECPVTGSIYQEISSELLVEVDN